MDHHDRSLLNCFAGCGLDRAAMRRSDPDWVAREMDAAHAVFVPVCATLSLVSHTSPMTPVLLDRAAVEQDLAAADSIILLGQRAGHSYFAFDLRTPAAESARSLEPRGRFADLKRIGGLLAGDAAGLLAYARAMVIWHRGHRYCGDCGQPTRSIQGGHMRECMGAACRRRHFPRTDPAVIVLVHNAGECLLARQADWPAGLHSVVAGFVEPGESIEETVVREVREETGLAVTDIHYRSSQPWPFPSSLMLGFSARATHRELSLDDEELAEARWLSRESLVKSVRRGELALPTPVSISFRLIEEWFDAPGKGRLAELAAQAALEAGKR